ncbi:uncharacterized protein LOC129914202 isoform X2 [Episyrphus balteatus]|uniref:uncharacterized protein LOC129914202 isoform X2 n=1 Tax=Episyrphus balteatus TaxID=286459 RepID=UPI002485657B|nr:uncharacterized protein LOC129914202 isoform X2 [Episyrphus balteatus]
MAFIHLIYFYIALLSFLINPKEVILDNGGRDSDIPLPFATSSSPAISAVLLECPNVQRRATASAAMDTSRPDCERQMMVHIRVSPSFQVETLDKFLLLDEVYDQKRKTRAKLMSPYLIEISRGEPVVMYPLQFAKSIRCDTCGHKNGNNTNTSQGNCEHPVDATISNPLPTSALHSGGTPVSGIHVSRSVQQEKVPREQHHHHQEHHQQQQQNTNEAPMGNGHNPTAASAGPRPSEKIESRQKLAIGILDSSHFGGEANKQFSSPVVDPKGFSSKDIQLRAQDEVNMMMVYDDVDVDEYDELNLNDDDAAAAAASAFGSAENSGQNTLRDKRLKTRPSLSSSNSGDVLFRRNGELFRETERQGAQQARMETLRAFTRKHVHVQPLGNDVGTSGPAPVDGYRATARSWVNVGKPHVVGIQEDCIRPQGAFDADEIDDVETDVGGKVVRSSSSSGGGDGRQELDPRLQLKSFLYKNGHQMDGAEMENLQIDGTQQKSQPRRPVNKPLKTSTSAHKGSLSNQKNSNSNSNREKENALLLASLKSVPGSHGPLQKELQQQQKLRLQKPDDIKNAAAAVVVVSPNTKFPFSSTDGDDSSDTQRFDANGSDADEDDGGGGEDYYDRIDASVRDSSVIESKGNITTSPDHIDTVAGGMGDEFYWNTLHYPSAKHKGVDASSSFHDDGLKISASDRGGKFHESLDHNVPRKLSNNVKANGRDGSNNKESGGAVKIHLERNYNDRQTASARRTSSKKSPDTTTAPDKDKQGVGASSKHPIKRLGSKVRREKFSDKSAMARNRMKIRSSDAVAWTGSNGGGGVVETSGMYTAKDGVVPAFPLNGYPGYLDGKASSEYIPPEHSKSQYRLLENEPQEYLPHQPPYAKELADPDLTVNDKINLLEVLADHDDAKDEILRNLENELDSSVIIHDITNHDRMPMPSGRLSRNGKKKNIKKRSYLTYDDLTMRDTDEQYDDMDMRQPIDVPLFDEERISKVEKCHSCSGNKCPAKRNDGESCTCDRKGRHCECSQKSEKKIRSVSDAWYSVFNMSAPLQFLTTRVGIYRKHHGTWWKTAPSITLTSLSGIYASENLSILFSSHVDIFQLRRPLTLQNHKLLIPHSIDSDDAPADAVDEVKAKHRNLYESINPKDVLAIDSSKFDINKIHDDSDTNNKEDDQSNGASVAAKRTLCHATSASERQRKQRSSSNHLVNGESEAVFSVGDLGYFPGNMNILEQCPSDPNHLCLNMLDEEAPGTNAIFVCICISSFAIALAFTIKIKQPFLKNALIFSGEYKVRIASVISDATTKGALQVAVVLVNEDCVAHEFTICICNCPMTCGAKTTVKKDLAPHISETVSFLLPLEEHKDTKLYCNVEVKSPDQKVISKRKFIVEPTARCLCIWDCDCHCIQDLVSHNDYDVCHKLTDYEEQAAGFIEGGIPDQDLTGWRWFWWRMNYYAFSLLLCMLFLGLLKAILGALCLRSFDRCGYDYVQPLKKYDYASRCRRFFINIVFFVVLPFICCCKCFTPNEEDLLMASTEWQCSLIQHGLYEDSSGDGDNNGGGGNGKWKKPSGLYYIDDEDVGQNTNNNDNNDDEDDDEETILRLSQNFESSRGRGSIMGMEENGGSPSRVTMSEYLLSTCEFDDGEEERDRNFVLQALTQSRESIKMLLKSHHSEDLQLDNPLTARAEDLVRQLVAAKIVYRTFEMALQRVDVPPGQKYSIQGFFVPAMGPGYQFIPTSPLLQHRRITTTTISSSVENTSHNLEPPNILRAECFQRTYRSKLEVLKAGDLSVAPPVDAPCINSSHTTNETQLTAESQALSQSPPPFSFSTPLQQYSTPPVDKLVPIANDVVREHGPAIANDTITRSDRVDDANNGSNLTAKQKDSPRGF